MTDRARRDGFILLSLGVTLFLLASFAMAMSPSANVVDFKAVYFASRCVMRGVNPYNEQEFLRVYKEEGGDRAEDSAKERRVVTTYINLPTGLTVITPFALLSWKTARVLWVAVIALSLVCATFLIWFESADRAPLVSASLLCIFLWTSIMLVDVGNTAGLIVALVAIAACLFLRNRYIWIGIICLAVSLLVKPHDAGFIWLYFVLISAVNRKRALHVLLLAVALGLPGVIWMSRVAPHWPSDLQRNLAAASATGDINDPGPLSASAHSADFIVDVQTVLSVFWDEPRFYNPASIALISPFIVAWVLCVIRSRDDKNSTWFALASIAMLTLLPVYHRQDDARLLLLTFPACTMLWSERNRVGKVALALTCIALFLNGDTPTVLRQHLVKPLLTSTSGFIGMVLTLFLDRPIPICLFTIGVFYLVLYRRRLRDSFNVLGEASQ